MLTGISLDKGRIQKAFKVVENNFDYFDTVGGGEEDSVFNLSSIAVAAIDENADKSIKEAAMILLSNQYFLNSFLNEKKEKYPIKEDVEGMLDLYLTDWYFNISDEEDGKRDGKIHKSVMPKNPFNSATSNDDVYKGGGFSQEMLDDISKDDDYITKDELLMFEKSLRGFSKHDIENFDKSFSKHISDGKVESLIGYNHFATALVALNDKSIGKKIIKESIKRGEGGFYVTFKGAPEKIYYVSDLELGVGNSNARADIDARILGFAANQWSEDFHYKSLEDLMKSLPREHAIGVLFKLLSGVNNPYALNM